MSEELGFKQSRLPEVGPGCLKPMQGRGGIPLPDTYYEQGEKFEVKTKKGRGIPEKIRQEKVEKSKGKTPSWSEVL